MQGEYVAIKLSYNTSFCARRGNGYMHRCEWVGEQPIYIQYHDEEWGVPVYDDRMLFEMLLLEGAQAGLSWITILNKRKHYRQAFDGFDASKVARYDQKKVASLLDNPGIVRNRLKVNAAIQNARSYLEIKERDTFCNFLWQFVDGKPIVNKWPTTKQVPASSSISEQMSKELKSCGFKFAGSTICYAFMQAVGMVNDHTSPCFRHQQIIDSYSTGL